MGKKPSSQTFVASSAVVHPTARVGKGTKIWAFSQIAEHASIGKDCVIGNGVYVDRFVKIGSRVRIHNKALLYHGVVIKDDVFIGPGVCFTNDSWPRSGLTRNLKGKSWTVHKGASIGANATILPDVTIGSHAVIGCGAVVTRDAPPQSLMYGNPARIKGWVCRCGFVLRQTSFTENERRIPCEACGSFIPLPRDFSHHPVDSKGSGRVR